MTKRATFWPSAASHRSIPLKASGVHFGHFYYGGLHIAKVRQEHFALKRRVRFRRHVIAVVDTLDQAYLDQTSQLTPHSVARHFEIARQFAKDHRTLEGMPNENLYRGEQQIE